jgi:septin family protein
MLDLLDTTNNVHYENYRSRKLTGIGPDNKKAIKDMNK